jgi:hypothetical protein
LMKAAVQVIWSHCSHSCVFYLLALRLWAMDFNNLPSYQLTMMLQIAFGSANIFCIPQDFGYLTIEAFQRSFQEALAHRRHVVSLPDGTNVCSNFCRCQEECLLFVPEHFWLI